MAQHTFHTDFLRLSAQDRILPAWWRVDLGTSYDVYQVVIVNRDVVQCNICINHSSRQRSHELVMLTQISKYIPRATHLHF